MKQREKNKIQKNCDSAYRKSCDMKRMQYKKGVTWQEYKMKKVVPGRKKCNPKEWNPKSVQNQVRATWKEKNATWKKCNTEKVQHKKKEAWKKCNMKWVQHEATRKKLQHENVQHAKRGNIKRIRWKKCNMEKVQPEKSVLTKKCNMKQHEKK